MILDRYTPIEGLPGENRLNINTASVFKLIIPTVEGLPATGATVAALGGNVLYTINGQDPVSTYGRPLPMGDEILLTNMESIRQFKCIRESGDATVYVQFFANA
jgi:hypothetical protein